MIGLIRAYRTLWAVRLVALAARIYPGDIWNARAEIARELRELERAR
jgi:hypothetical protein